MEQNNNAESKLIYVGDAEYLIINELKPEPLDNDHPSDVVKVNQREIHGCVKCTKLSHLINHFIVTKRFVMEIPTTLNH